LCTTHHRRRRHPQHFYFILFIFFFFTTTTTTTPPPPNAKEPHKSLLPNCVPLLLLPSSARLFNADLRLPTSVNSPSTSAGTSRIHFRFPFSARKNLILEKKQSFFFNLVEFEFNFFKSIQFWCEKTKKKKFFCTNRPISGINTSAKFNYNFLQGKKKQKTSKSNQLIKGKSVN
jgi:hypothetical protein